MQGFAVKCRCPRKLFAVCACSSRRCCVAGMQIASRVCREFFPVVSFPQSVDPKNIKPDVILQALDEMLPPFNSFMSTSIRKCYVGIPSLSHPPLLSIRHCKVEESIDSWEACVVYFRRPLKNTGGSLGGGSAAFTPALGG